MSNTKTAIDMKQHNICKLLLALLSATLFTGCQETDYLVFDADFCGIYFQQDTIRYSFGVTPVETREYTVNIPVKIMGATGDAAREIGFRIIPDSTFATENVQYRFGEAVVLPDSINGYIPLVVLRDGLEGDFESGYTHYKVGLQLTENSHFVPTRSLKEQICVIRFDNAIEQPNWVNYRGDKIWYENKLGLWHPYKLIKMVEFYHEIANIQPETYKKMAALYGENLESSEYGSFASFGTAFKKYVITPTYEFFRDHKEETLALYPNFPYTEDYPDGLADPNSYDLY